MGFAGRTFSIPCNQGGFSFDKNTDTISPSMFVMPSRNINLHQNGREKRGGTEKVNGTAVSGSPRILGLFDFRLPSSSFQVFGADDGSIYKNSTTTIQTGLSTTGKFGFCIFDNELYAWDGANNPYTWDGAAASMTVITTPAADWATSKPIQMVAHGRGASRRLWALAGNAVYYSSLGNGKEFSGGTSGKITIDVQDSYGLVGMCEFGDRLIVFSRTQSFIIDDTDTSYANWGYAAAQWTGGAAHWRLILVLENDVLVGAEDGQVYSVTAAQEYGDYKKASIMRPAYIDNYFKANAALSSIADFHLAYDRNLRAVKYFFVRSGQTEVDSALVYFIDRGADQGWSLHDNQSSASGYSASCSAEVRTGDGTYLLYTGDYDGFIWKLEQATRSDDSAGFYGGFKTPNINFGDPRLRKHYRQLRCIMESQGDYNLQVSIWVDGESKTGQTISMSGAGAVLGSFVLGTDVLSGTEFIDGRLDLNYVGKRIQLEFYNSNAAQNFFVSQILIDFKPLPLTT